MFSIVANVLVMKTTAECCISIRDEPMKHRTSTSLCDTLL